MLSLRIASCIDRDALLAFAYLNQKNVVFVLSWSTLRSTCTHFFPVSTRVIGLTSCRLVLTV